MNKPDWLLIVGCGYVGSRVANLAKACGTSVFALTRSSARFDELREQGIVPIQGNWHDDSLEVELSKSLPPGPGKILVAIPHREETGSNGKSLGQATHRLGLANLWAARGELHTQLVYLSSTGVYGESDGDVVNESTPVSPTRIGPEIAVEAERWLEQHCDHRAYTVLRLAGIYGPGRIPLAAKLRSGETLQVPTHGHLNLVHVDDIARIVMHALNHPLSRPEYVVSDGNPVARIAFYTELARLCGVAKPVFESPAEDSTRLRRATDKRIDPSCIWAETQLQPIFPSYESGLPNALGQSS